MIAYADDSTLYTVIKSPSDRLAIAKSLNLDLAKIDSCYNLWGMFLNPRKSTSIEVSRYRNMNPPHRT